MSGPKCSGRATAETLPPKQAPQHLTLLATSLVQLDVAVLKVCPDCGTVCSNDELDCGVCGLDIRAVRPQVEAEAVRESEEIERESELKTTRLDRAQYLKKRRKFLVGALIRLTIGPMFAIAGFVAILDLASHLPFRPGPGFTAAFLVMMVGFANIFSEFWQSGPPFGYAKVLWMVVKAKELTEMDEKEQGEVSG